MVQRSTRMIYLSNVSQTQHIGHRISEIKHVILFQNYLPIRTPSTGSRAVTTVSTTTISTKTTSSTAAVSSVCRWNTGYICSFGINLKRRKKHACFRVQLVEEISTNTWPLQHLDLNLFQAQCSTSIPSENVRKPKVEGYRNGILD